jgi:anti-anti-sigma factor
MPSAETLSHNRFCTRPPARSRRVATGHSGMSLRTHFQPSTTIVEVQVAVDGRNAERLSDHVEELASPGRSLILDLRGVAFFSRDGLRVLARIAQESHRTGGRWALVTSEAVDRLLPTTDSNYRLPTAPSPEEALRQLTPHSRAWSLPQYGTPAENTRC